MYRTRYPDDPGMHNVEDTQTTYRQNPSFCDRIRQSLVAVVVGIGLLTVASGMIFWNEGRAVQTAKSLQEGIEMVIPLQSAEVAFDENNGKLVHVSGPLQSQGVLYDSEYSVAVSAVRLHRKTEMYQWVEAEHTREVGTGESIRKEITYTYSPDWRSDVVRSTQFANPTGHHNPNEFSVKAEKYVAEGVQVGNLFLSEGLIGLITNFRQLKIEEVPKGKTDVILHQGMLYHGNNPLQPQVGDVRVTFEYAGLSGKTTSGLGPPDVVSVIARQAGRQLTPYQSEAGDTLEFLYFGKLTAQQIFQKEQAQNSVLTWGMRFGGWLLMFVGFGCLTRIIVTLVDWMPIVRDVVNLGVTTLNLFLSISLSLTIIAMGWIWYRPWLGIGIIVMAALPFILSRRRAIDATNRRSYPHGNTHRDW